MRKERGMIRVHMEKGWANRKNAWWSPMIISVAKFCYFAQNKFHIKAWKNMFF
jgi:hypothetical protein